jgi:hypothetical protein
VNPSESQSYYPSFLNAFDLELEGFKTRALTIEAGADFKITGSDINNLTGASSQGNADDVAVRILADTHASYTRGVSISASRIGNCRSSAIWNDSRDLQLSNDIFYTTSHAGAGMAPVIRLGATSTDSILDNIQCEEFGGSALASHCVQIDAGATSVLISNVNAQYVQTGAINDMGGNLVTVLNALNPNGTLVGSGGTPSLANCGTAPTVGSAANDSHGTLTTGAGAPTGCTVTFSALHARAPDCVVSSPDGVSVTYSTSVAALTLSFTAAPSRRFSWVCAGL